jgi:hypothetical protein
MTLPARSISVTPQGEPDGWEIPAGYLRDLGPGGATQLVVSVPAAWLGAVHRQLVAVLGSPLGFMYRQVVDRRDPKPQGAPPRDFVGLDLPSELLIHALSNFEAFLYHDARSELWARGPLGDQVILDADGLLYVMPDDPAFVDVLRGVGLTEGLEETIRDRDYARHTFHAANDALEDAFVRELRLTEVVHRKGA